MKYINKLAVMSLLVLGSVGCSDDYLDINTSPTTPTASNITPDLSLAGAIMAPNDHNNVFGRVSPLSVNAMELGAVFMQQWAGDINNFAAVYTNEYRLNITTDFREDIFVETYRGLATIEAILDFDGENYDNHKAIARINKAFYFQLLVDLYGDIPYSEALKRGSNLNPVYDDAQDIYRDLIVQLDMAIAEFNNADGDDVVVGAEDVAFQGNLERWVQFANTLKLRILLRQSNLADNDGGTSTYLNQQFANLDNNFLTEDSFLNPGYTNSEGKQNPFYAAYGEDAQGTVAQTSIVATDYIAEFMKGTSTQNGISTGVNDIRLDSIYQQIPSEGEVVGVIQGASDNEAPDDLSKLNLGSGILKSSAQNLYLITAAESYFLQSEAAFRGYISGDAKGLFQSGIRASFNLLNITDEDGMAVSNYLDNSNNTNLIGWDGSANKIEAIMTQKWMALNGFNSIESWIEFRRTGFPDVPLPTIAQRPARPVRLLYPATELQTNSANVPSQTADSAFNNPIFWDVD